MVLSRNKIFTFTWRIENFSMCSVLPNQKMESSTFAVDFWQNSKWTLWLYPRGLGNAHYVSIFLRRTVDLEKTTKVSYMFTIISCNPEKNIKRSIDCCKFTKRDPMWGWKEFCCREIIFNTDNVLSKNDVLIINCHMWKTGIDVKVATDTIVSRNTICWTLKKSSNVNKCSSITRINVESKSVLWIIKRFSEMQNAESFVKTVASVKQGGPAFDLTFYMKESAGKRKRNECILNHCSHLDIRRNNADDLSKRVFIRCKVKTLGSPKGIQREGEHHFEGHGRDQIWKFPVFIKGKKIIDDYLYYTDDVLYLLCKFTFSVEGDVAIFKDNSSVNSIRRSSNMYPYYLTHYHHQLYKDDAFSDVTIRTSNRVFKVHKCILVTRSPVFRAMFETDMQEKESGVVKIFDLKADTVDRMLNFMYTGILEGGNHTDFAALYCAADKYDVVPLKCRCRCALMSNLVRETVGEVFHLAYMYQDEDLLDAAGNFIQVKTDEARKDFEINNFQFFAETIFNVPNNLILIFIIIFCFLNDLKIVRNF